MLEKIGLPSKPSQRGSNWVVDASHCQGCSSQFTFINRKHHCRRCGGLFCNSCTQQRMVLRGQGDLPVRICEPCKKLEEAARFEMRYGRSRVGKGSSKSISKSDNEMLNEILGSDIKEASASGVGSSSKAVSIIERASSLTAQEVTRMDAEERVHKSNSLDELGHRISEREIASPEDLREKALEEKKKYKVLKAERKSDEALKAFKRGKELERQADALEASLRKSRRKALLSQHVEEFQAKDDSGESRRGNKAARLGKEKDDLAAELRELGWSDMDLHNEDKKGTNITLEGEFSSLLGEISEKTKKIKGSNASDKSQVLAHKKKALALKREGNLAEAKEELKRAKVLEKQLEEQELLATAEDSDDELSALIRSMDSDKSELSSDLYEQDHDCDFASLIGTADQIVDGNFDVTDEDMEDPEMAAALKSFGWVEDSDSHESIVPQIVSVGKEALSNEILSLKREALSQKRAGNVSEAMALLKKAKLLERDLESSKSQEGKFAKEPTRVQKDSTHQAASQSSPPKMVSDENTNAIKDVDSKLAPRKTKLMIQKELLGLKKKALALRRQGRFDEAEEELKKGKILEHQLEEMEKSPSNAKAMPMAAQVKVGNLAYDDPPVGDEEREDVTDQDMNDPAYLSLLKNLGWNDEHNDLSNSMSGSHERNDNHSVQISESCVSPAAPVVSVGGPRKSKAEMQRELLGLKRKALALRRQGESEEAEEVLRKAKDLEAQMADMEQPAKEVQVDISSQDKNAKSPLRNVDEAVDAEVVKEKDLRDPAMLLMLKNLGWNDEEQENVTMQETCDEKAAKSVHSSDTSVSQSSRPVPVISKNKAQIQRELLNLKRKALALRRQGEIEESEEVLNMAKVLEAQIQELEAPKQVQLQEALKDEIPNDFGSPSNQEEHGNLLDNLGRSSGTSQATSGPNSKFVELPSNAGSMGSDTDIQGYRNSDLAVPCNSPLVERDQMMLGHVGPWNSTRPEDTSIPPPGDSANLIDLLTGDDWGGSQMSSEKHEDVLRDEKPGVYESNPIVEHTSVARKDDFRIDKRFDLLTGDDWGGSQMSSEKLEDVLRDERPGVYELNPNVEHTSVARKDDFRIDKRRNIVQTDEKPHVQEASSTEENASQSNESSLKQDILTRKRKAVALKREGKLAEALEELRRAKLLEKRLSERGAKSQTSPAHESVSLSKVSSVGQQEHGSSSTITPKPISSRDKFKLQQESLAHKRQALKLRREGRTEEAEAEFELAKALETQLEEISAHHSNNSTADGTEPEGDIGVEDFLDPQLLSALKAIGIDDANVVSRVPDRPLPSKPIVAKSENHNLERIQLEEQIKAEKVKALNLKRSGRQAEALDALRKAKLLEKKLNS